ncbi:MAG: hypothetical protein ACJ74Z_07290 [Bryobacteraceae bacterium]
MFKAKVQVLLAAGFASACASVSLGSQTDSADGDSASRTQQVQIRVFNLARVPRRDLSRAESEVTRIFAEAGMGVHWVDGALDDNVSLVTDFSGKNSTATGCKVASQARSLSVRLLPHAPQGLAAGTLGFSLPCAAFGIDSTIFVDRCEGVTYQTPASLNKVLAYAIAHELGHVLLRSSEHSLAGLMRARWDKAAWQRAAVEGIPIDRQQARRMRMELARMSESNGRN